MLEEYLTYLNAMEDLNISIEGEFMEMAATLIQIKLRSLLPRSVEEDLEDPRTELVNNLLAYQKGQRDDRDTFRASRGEQVLFLQING